MGSCTTKMADVDFDVETTDSELEFIPFSNRVDNVWKLFKKTKQIGKGATGSVYKATRKSDGKVVALKQLDRFNENCRSLFEQEYRILSAIDHPNILKLENVYVDKKNLYISTNLCEGEQLLEKVQKMHHFSEKVAANIIRKLLETINFCHEHDIVHRDLKPENIMFNKKGDDGEIVIIDWGEATIADSWEFFSDFVGTPFYLAPEMMRSRQGWELKKCDIWSIGVISYVLLTGCVPFYGRNNNEIISKIMSHHIRWPKEVHLSEHAKHFVMSLLAKNTKSRLTAKQALEHPWLDSEVSSSSYSPKNPKFNPNPKIKSPEPSFEPIPRFRSILKWAMKNDQHLGEHILENITNYHNACRLKKLIVNAIIKDMTSSEKNMIKMGFRAIDVKHKGFIGKNEIQIFLESSGLCPSDAHSRAQQLVLELGDDKTGQIYLKQFVRSHVSQQLSQPEIFNDSFQRIDVNRNRMLSDHEIKDFLQESFNFEVTQRTLLDIINEVDNDGDGRISYGEFTDAMTR